MVHYLTIIYTYIYMYYYKHIYIYAFIYIYIHRYILLLVFRIFDFVYIHSKVQHLCVSYILLRSGLTLLFHEYERTW